MILRLLPDLGLKVKEQKELPGENFKRFSVFTNGIGLEFKVIWYINLVTIRFGDWGKGLIDFTFQEIKGSYIPYDKHLTLDFIDNGNAVARIAMPENINMVHDEVGT